MLVSDEQLAEFVPSLDARFRTHCIEALRARPQSASWKDEQIDCAVDVAIERAQGIGLSEERSILAYLLLATEIVLAKPQESVLRAVEAILGDQNLTEWQRVYFAADYFHQMHRRSG